MKWLYTKKNKWRPAIAPLKRNKCIRIMKNSFILPLLFGAMIVFNFTNVIASDDWKTQKYVTKLVASQETKELTTFPTVENLSLTQCSGASVYFPVALTGFDTITANYHCFNNSNGSACPSYKTGNTGFTGKPHSGLDIFPKNKTTGAEPVYAVAAGTIIAAPPQTKSAVVIESIVNGNTYYFLYTHMANSSGSDKYGGKYGLNSDGEWVKLRNFSIGEKVNAGEQIGRVGTYNTSGTHLHFSITPQLKKGVVPGSLSSGFDDPNSTIDPTPFLWGENLNYDKFDNDRKKTYNGTGFVCLAPPKPPCPAPSSNLISFYKYPNQDCGNEGAKAVYTYDPKGVFNSISPVTITVPFKPGSIYFPTTQLNPDTEIKTNRPYTFRPKHINITKNGDLVLDASGNSIYPGTPIIQWGWNSQQNNQKWGFEKISEGVYQIINHNSGLCLAGNGLGNTVTQESCTGDNVLWNMEYLGTPGNYRVIHKTTGYALDVKGASTSWGTDIILWYKNNALNQQWHICETAQLSLSGSNLTFAIKENVADTSGYSLVDGPNTFQLRANQLCPTTTTSGISLMSSCINNAPPNPPRTTSPINGFSQLNNPPKLCWASQGDPDNKTLSFRVEIESGGSRIYSGWNYEQYCWYPTELVNKFGTYNWRVQARDFDLATSYWSASRTFTIEAPNKPPAISLNTSNGNISDTILSRDGTWTFTGTASDPENDLRRIEFRCSGDGCGSQSAHSNGTSWSHTQTGMWGENEVRFVAFDGYTGANNGQGNMTYSRTVKLLIDQAAPTTQISLNGSASSTTWPVWFTVPVQVNLLAQDGASGRARAGIQRLYYRLDGGSWTAVEGDQANLTVESDGPHTMETYSVDRLGNTETARFVTFRIDSTPPLAPTGAVDTNGSQSNLWQNAGNIPTFTWDASSDLTSGLWGYQLYFGSDPAGIGYENFSASQTRTWTPLPGGVRTGTYYLRGRTRDIAGNWSSWTDMFTYRYDGTAPENPNNVQHAMGIESTVWQRLTSAPDFAWPVAYDEGSGIQGYYTYWGSDENGIGADILTDPSYRQEEELCPDTACVGYLRLRSVDNVGNIAGEWSTAFILRYDNAPPSVDFTVNGGEDTAAQTQITLNILAEDLGSGVKAMRFSTDGATWTPWEVYTLQRAWQLPPVSRQSWPIYIQVQDGVGLVSEPALHAVSLDVNPEQPRSANFRLFNGSQIAGSAELGSDSFASHGTLGQAADTPFTSSANYMSWNGYEAGSAARPILIPGHDDFITVNGAFVAGNGISVLVSEGYRMAGTFNEYALPNNEPDLTSATFRHQPGFLAAQPSLSISNQTAPGEEPAPISIPECTVPFVKIANNALFTQTTDVTLTLCAPHAVEMMVSSQEALADANWEPYATNKPWVLAEATQEVQARHVYAAFRDENGRVYGTYVDSITLDQTKPEGDLLSNDDISPQEMSMLGLDHQAISAIPDYILTRTLIDQIEQSTQTVITNPDGSVNLMMDAMDNNSGIVEMQIDLSSDFANAVWEPFTPVKAWMPPDETDGWKTVYARFKDGAGNLSDASQITILVDRQAPYGGVWIEQRTVRPEARQIELNFFASDDTLDAENGTILVPGSGVSVFRIAQTEDLSGAAWQPYTENITWPVELTDVFSGEIYVQFRDAAGNESWVVSDEYHVDIAAPDIKASVRDGVGLERMLVISGRDDLSEITKVYVSNDPLMLKDVEEFICTGEEYPWIFDETRVAWIVAEDAAGNRSQPAPVFAEDQLTNQVFLPLVLR